LGNSFLIVLPVTQKDYPGQNRKILLKYLDIFENSKIVKDN